MTLTGRVGTGDSEEMTRGGEGRGASEGRLSTEAFSLRIWKGEPREAAEGVGKAPWDKEWESLATPFDGPSRVRTGGASSTGVGGFAPSVLGVWPLE